MGQVEVGMVESFVFPPLKLKPEFPVCQLIDPKYTMPPIATFELGVGFLSWPSTQTLVYTE